MKKKRKYFLNQPIRRSILFIAFLFACIGTSNAQYYGQEGFKLVGTNPIGYSPQGSSVAISADGNTAIVAADQDNGNVGAVYFYKRTGNFWTQEGPKIIASDAVGTPRQGYSVSISADGNTAVVGGYVDSNPVGAAYVYTRSGGVWTQQGTKLVGTNYVVSPIQGWSVSISGDGNTILVGGYGDNNYTGAVWAFTRSGGVWSQQGDKLVGTGGLVTSGQGQSVSLSYDGNTAIVGAKHDNGNTGAAWVYTRSGGTWSQAAKLVGTGNLGAAWQGQSVGMSGDGNTAIVGGYLDNGAITQIGAAWIYTRSGDTWTQQGAKLVSNDYVGPSQQGSIVSLSYDGNKALVSGWNDNSAVGCLWMYTRSGGIWTQLGNKLLAGDRVGIGRLGTGSALSADGNTIIAGGPYDNGSIGAAWVFSACTSAPPKAAITGGPSGIICSGYTLTVADTSTVGKYISSYLWSDGSTTAASNPITTPGTYSVTITNSCGYTSTASIVITTVNASPVTTITGDNYFCSGSSTVLTVSDAASTAGPYTYNWNNGITTSTNTISTIGTYTVSITNGIGCINSASKVMTSNPISVTATGGTGASGICYQTLRQSFDAINAGVHTGAIAIRVLGNTTETLSCVLNESGNGSASYTNISIQPSGGEARTITCGLSNQALLELNGADNVVIDGLNTGGNSLSFINTSVATSLGTATIRFINDASNNKITRCNIQGNSASVVGNAGAGTIVFSTASVNGNDNDTISYCNISSQHATSMATRHIYAGGTVGMENDGLVIDHNYIGNFFRTNASSAAIDIASGTTGATISNNKIYQSATRTFTTVNLFHRMININNAAGSGYKVLNNRLGFADTSGTGTYNYNFSNVVSTTAMFTAIYLNVGTAAATSVQGNTLTNMAVAGSSIGTGVGAPFKGIYVVDGLVKIGDVTGNTIGSMTATGNITFTSTGSSPTDVIGILVNGSSNALVSNNNIGGISVNTAVNAARNFYGIRSLSSGATSIICNNNTIGGDIANSIRSTSTQITSKVNGIMVASSTSSLTGNIIRNMATQSGNGVGPNAGMAGIVLTGATDQTVVNNQIYNLSSAPLTIAEMNGICVSASAVNKVERNLIYGFGSTSVLGAVISGIRIEGGTGTYTNNMISIGEGITTINTIHGFNETAGLNNIVSNSVYIGGSQQISANNSYGLISTVSTGMRSIRNNIFFNARTNAGTATGVHYGISVFNTDGLNINNNLYYANGTGNVFGRFGGADVADLDAWKLATAQDANSISGDPLFVAPAAATADLHIKTTVPSIVDAAGVSLGVLTDYDGQTRASLTPSDIGADAFIVCIPTTATLNPTACASYTLNGTTYTASGTYTQVLTNVHGCDSTITVNLTINQPTTATLNPTACSSYTLNGTTYNTSGTYTQLLTNAIGCDSTITLNLTINQPTTATLNPTACVSYTLNGTTYNTSGTYTQLLTNAIGCDSTITLNLTINQPTTSTLTETATGSYTLNGTTYNTSGTYTQLLTNVQGCDSTITLNLTIQNLTAITPSQCGITLQFINTVVNADALSGATAYRFRITNGASVQTIDKATPSFSFTELASHPYNTTYTVDVAVDFGSGFGDYGTACSITTPTVSTQVQASQCGITLASLSTAIYADALAGATMYRFRITNGANVQIIDKVSRTFNLTQLASYDYSTTYSVDIAAQLGGTFGSYGHACEVTTPSVASKVQAAQCGTTLATLATAIKADIPLMVTAYRFRIINGANVQTIDKNENFFRFTELASYDYGTTYTIDVAVELNGVFGPYGTACNVSTPVLATKVVAAQCGTTLAVISTAVKADAVTLATTYRFRITEGADVQTIDKTENYFRLTELASYAYGTTYTIDVAVEVNGVFSTYGTACNIHTPVLVTKIQASQCGITLASISTAITADAVTGVTQYRFRITEGANVQTIDKATRSFNLTQLASYAYGTTYTIDVAVQYNGAYTSYGPACIVTSPSPATKVQAAQCGSTLPLISSAIKADIIPMVGQYRFRITEGANVQTIDKSVNYFRLTELASYAVGTTYMVDVAVQVNGTWFGYGSACELTTPSPVVPRAGSTTTEFANAFDAAIYPNPFAAEVGISISTESTEAVRVSVYDMTGKLITGQTASVEELNTLRIGSEYAAGVYQVIVVQGTDVKTLKVVKQ